MVWCQSTNDIVCQESLRERTIYLTEVKWRELEKRLNSTLLYFNTLRKLGTVTLHLVNENYHISRRDKRRIIRAWRAHGFGRDDIFNDVDDLFGN